MRFGDIIGRHEIKGLVVQQIGRGRLPHAQIIEGRAGYQSLAFAMAYAQYINCENPLTEGDSCGVCPSCIKSEALAHTDIYYIFPACVPLGKRGKKDDYTSSDLMPQWREAINSSTPLGCFREIDWYKISGIGGEKGNTQGSIGRAEAEYISSMVTYKPIEGGRRIFIIWLPEKMNNSAANALLKLFEEPSEHNIFLFVSINPEQVLNTIVSRTQRITIPAIESQHMFEYLKSINQKIDSDELMGIVNVANGDIIEAITAMNGNSQEVNLELFITLTRMGYAANTQALITWAEEFATLNKEAQKNFFIDSIAILRQAFISSLGLDSISYSYGKHLEFTTNFKRVINRNNISGITSHFEKAYFDLQHNGNARIVATHFALTLTKELRVK